MALPPFLPGSCMTYPFATSTIVIQAFGFLELAHPSSFADDTPEATDALANYELALDLCLEWSDWSFASRMVALPEAALPADTIADPDLPHTFALPGDCVMLRELKQRGVAYRLDERLLRADRPGPLPIRYTRRITNESALPASFRTAVALQLAVLMAPRWLGISTKRDALAQNLQMMREQAGRPDARTASSQPIDDMHPFAPDWVSGALR